MKAQHVARDCRDLLTLWPELAGNHQRLRHRPYAQQQPNLERQAKLNEQIKQERKDRFDPRFTGKVSIVADPVNWHAVSVIEQGTYDVLWLENELREKLADNVRLMSYELPARPRLIGPVNFESADLVLAERLTSDHATNNVSIALRYLATAVWRTDETVLGHAGKELARVLREVRSALGDPPRARWMPEARCPYCNQLTLFVFDPRDDDTDERERPANYAHPQATIRCCANHRGDDETGKGAKIECLCPAGRDGMCKQDCHAGGRHSWPEDDWERIAEVLYRGPAA